MSTDFSNVKFPIPASLFWKDSTSGQYETTWRVLSEQFMNHGVNDRLATKQIEYGSHMYTFIVYHAGDPECICNPWMGNPNAAQVVSAYQSFNPIPLNEAKWNQWKTILKLGEEPNTYFVPTALCGDDRASTTNVAFLNYYLPAFIIGLYPYVAAYNLSTEASKTMSVPLMEQALAIMNNAFIMDGKTPKPLCVHLQWDRRSALPAGMNVLMYEFSWHPKYGKDKSVDEVVAEARDVLAHLPPGVSVWFQEMTIECELDIARRQAQAIRDLAASDPRIVGLPGPV